MRSYIMHSISVIVGCLFCLFSYSQNATVSGPTLVQYGETDTYTVSNWPSPLNPAANVVWNADGGTVISQTRTSCQIQWSNTATVGFVTVHEDISNMYGDLPVTVGYPRLSLSPSSLQVDYGTSSQYLFISLVTRDPPSSAQWQTSPDGANSWTTAAPAGATFYPPTISPAYYRYAATIDGTIYYSNVAYVSLNALDPGVITLSQRPAYNAAPVVTNTPGHYPGPPSYTWEQSIDGQPWTTIGTGVNYPSNAVITGNTAVRRKITSNGVTMSSNLLYIVPVYTSVDYENLNYVRTIDVHVAGINTWYQADQLTTDSKSQSTTYLDGLGRPIQKVDKSASLSNGAWVDLVQPIVYDAAGRTTQNYLPYPTTDNPGKFKSTNVLAQQASFVTTKFGEPSGAPTYTQIVYDNSPLNRVMATYMPGQNWGGNTVGVKSGYDFNTVDESVHIWNLAYAISAIPTTSTSAVYATGSLYKSIGTDEKNKQVITYTDFSGNVILKKVQLAEAGSGLSNQHAGWACTYYVYDDMNQQRFVITPKAVTWLDNNSWNLSQQIVNDLCFVNGYDGKGRTISKKQPGAGEMDIVYDQRNRPIYTQDANGSSVSQWQAAIYDGLDRVGTTGVFSVNMTQATLQSYADANTGNVTISSTTTIPGLDNLNYTQRVVGTTTYVASNSITFTATQTSSFVCEAGDAFIAYIDVSIDKTVNDIVSNPDNPIPVNNFIPLTQAYYDDYSHNAKAYTTADNPLFDPSTNQQAQALPAQPNPQTRGLLTCYKVWAITNALDLRQGNWLETDTYYDDQGRAIQTLNGNSLGGTDIVTNRYDFAGKLWGSCVRHMAGSASPFTIVSKNTYDVKGRLTDVSKNFNGTLFKDLASYTYDEYGKMIKKTLAPGYTGTGNGYLETLKYDYNIQGWLTGINKDYALSTNTYDQWNEFFGLYLGYANGDNQFAAGQFNGSITGVIWKSQGDNSMRKYDYTYDNMGRFTSGLFNQRKTPADGWSNAVVDLSEYVSYTDASGNNDLNGNIQTMKHMGMVPGMTGGVVVDDLLYTYSSASSNRLSKVDERATFAGNGQLNDFKDGTNAAGTNDYSYDANGNLVQDQNKGITDGTSGVVSYNHLNKPYKITIAGKSIVQYTYDATGAKLSKTVTNLSVTPNTSTTTTYDNEFVYQDNVLQFVLHEEGRMKIITPVNTPQRQINAGPAGATNVQPGKVGVFEYFIKDQLNNTRMVLTEEAQTEYYIATMETTSSADPNLAADEENLFGQVDPNTGSHANNELLLTRTHTPATWSGNTTANVVMLTASDPTKKIGPNIILKVSAGDVINATSQYFYATDNNAGTTNGVSDALGSLVSSLLASRASMLGKMNSGLINSNLGASGGDFTNFINGHPSSGTNPNAPKAFLNVIFMDEQFNFIAPDQHTSNVGSSYQRVSSANDQNALPLLLQKKAPKNGWVYIYLSNESNQSVYFDNFSVSQVHGRISEENHYYAFGQKIAGLCTSAVGKLPNKYKYQGDYAEEEENTGWNEFDLRMYDPQIGRWTGMDPYDEFASPYVGMGNDPVNSVDPDGGDIDPYFGYNIYQGLLSSGYCVYCEVASKAQTLAAVVVTPQLQSGSSIWNTFKVIANVSSVIINGGMQQASNMGRGIMIRAAAAEMGAIHAATFGAVSSEPIFSVGYTQDDLSAHYGAALAGQVIPSLIEGSGIAPNSSLQLAPTNWGPVRFNLRPTLPVATVYSQSSSANNLSLTSRPYDRPFNETRSGKAVREKDVLNDWNNFLGPDQTGIDPRDGLPDPDRIWSLDGQRSIRFGAHETSNSNPNRWHYHKETWYHNFVENLLQRIQK